MKHSKDTTFMKSWWWVFKQFFDIGQVYRAYQIMPVSALAALCIPLNQVESKQDDKMTLDPAILVAFPTTQSGAAGFDGTPLVIYTATPWTLPSNLFNAAHPGFKYTEILEEDAGKVCVILEQDISMLYKGPKKAEFKVT